MKPMLITIKILRLHFFNISTDICAVTPRRQLQYAIKAALTNGLDCVAGPRIELGTSGL